MSRAAGAGPFPPSASVDVSVLLRLLDDATTSYKHLFFRALLEAFKAGGFENTRWPIAGLALGMLQAAWYPSRVCRLSLGSRDQVAPMLATIGGRGMKPPAMSALADRVTNNRIDLADLRRYVPYRLISPFFEADLRGVPDYRRSEAIKVAAGAKFDEVRPLYRFPDDETIELHPAWAEYLTKNWGVVSGWAERRWIAYLQARNPLAPAVSEKVAAPAARASLARQTAYWAKALERMAAEGHPAACIYSGAALDPGRLNLDHFLPWTFVCHDALWNLAPVLGVANSAKGDRIPDASYLTKFVSLQHGALEVASKEPDAFGWKDIAAEFADGLRIDEDALRDRDGLMLAYASTVRPQMTIADAIGFEGGWTYR